MARPDYWHLYHLGFTLHFRLASLHMYQHALAANGPGSKVTIKMVEKEYGLERFVPLSLADSMKKKEMQKLLGHFLKLNSNLLGPGETKGNII